VNVRLIPNGRIPLDSFQRLSLFPDVCVWLQDELSDAQSALSRAQEQERLLKTTLREAEDR
jgi:hypothetical protein